MAPVSDKHLLRIVFVCAVLLAIDLFFAVQASCQEPSKDTPIKLALAHYVAMNVTDAIQTTSCVQAHRCTEQNPALAPMVNNTGTFLAVRAGVTSAAVWGIWKARTNHPKLAKWLAVSLAAGQTVVVVSNARQLQKAGR